MSAKGKKIHHTNKSSQPKQRLYVTIHDIDNHSADEKNSCQAKPPMDSSIIILKQPKNRQSPGSIKNVSICANARKNGDDQQYKENQGISTRHDNSSSDYVSEKPKKTRPSSGLQQGGNENNRRKSRTKSNVEKYGAR